LLLPLVFLFFAAAIISPLVIFFLSPYIAAKRFCLGVYFEWGMLSFLSLHFLFCSECLRCFLQSVHLSSFLALHSFSVMSWHVLPFLFFVTVSKIPGCFDTTETPGFQRKCFACRCPIWLFHFTFHARKSGSKRNPSG